MRRNPVRLINPAMLGERHLIDRLGGATVGELRRQSQVRLVYGDPRPRKRPAITGQRATDAASEHLLRELVARGLIRDETYSEGAG